MTYVRGAKAVTWDWDIIQSVAVTRRCYSLTDRQVAFLMTVFIQALWSTRWFNQPDDFKEIEQFVNDTALALINTVECSNPCPPSGGGGGKQLPDGVRWDGENLIIDLECEMGIIINQYGCGCGCGDGQRSSFGGGLSGGGGASGSWITEPDIGLQYAGQPASQCDMVTGGWLDYVLDLQAEVLQTISGSSNLIGTVLDGLAALNPIGTVTADGVDWLTNISVDAADAALAVWNDVDFRDNVKIAWVKLFDGETFSNGVTRQQLLTLGQNIQQVWFVDTYPVEARFVWSGITRMINMTKINQRLAAYVGECVQSEYTYYKAAAGIPYTPPTDPNTLPVPFPFVYDWGRNFDFKTAVYLFSNGGFGGNASWVDGSGWTRGGAPSAAANIALQSFGISSVALTGAVFTFNAPLAWTVVQLQYGYKIDVEIESLTLPTDQQQYVISLMDYPQLSDFIFRFSAGILVDGYFLENLTLYGTGLEPEWGDPL